MALRWRESVAERHNRRHGPAKARYIRQINWITPQWPVAGWAGLMMAALALFLFFRFALYLPWYAVAIYAALVAGGAAVLRTHWSLWVRQAIFFTAFAGVMLLLVRITTLDWLFVAALWSAALLALWMSWSRERDIRERDAFRRVRE